MAKEYGDGNNWRDLKTAGDTSTEYTNLDLDPSGQKDIHYVDHVDYKDDRTDYLHFRLDTFSRLRISLCSGEEDTDGVKTIRGGGPVKLTVYRLVKTTKNGADTYSLKSVMSMTTTWRKEFKYDEEYQYLAKKKILLLKPDDYYISISAVSQKKEPIDYDMDLSAIPFTMSVGGDVDDWHDHKESGSAGLAAVPGIVINQTGMSYKEKEEGTARDVFSGWVGSGDVIDYRKITLEDDARLSFSIEGTGPAKFSLYRLETKTDSKTGEEIYSLKKLQSKTLKKLKPVETKYWYDGEDFQMDTLDPDNNYTGKTKSIFLQGGNEYYISIESSSAKKGKLGFVSYDIWLSDKTVFFKPDGRTDVLLTPEKTLVAEAAAGGLLDQRAITITKSTNDILFEAEAIGYNDSEEKLGIGKIWNNFVGYGDKADYMKITLKNRAKLSFYVEAKDAAKFIIYKLTPKEDGTYTQKALQTTTLSKKTEKHFNEGYDCWEYYDVKYVKYTYYKAKTKGYWLDAGDYYISVKSTKADKGGYAYYNVSLNQAGCSGLDSFIDAGALTGPESVADLAMPETGGPALQDELSAGLNPVEPFTGVSSAAALADSAFDGVPLYQSSGLLA